MLFRSGLFDAMKVKGDFLATMSHELRTPLNSILGFSEVLSSADNLTDRQRRYVGNIDGSGRSLLALINDILDFSKIEAGRMVLEPTKLDIVSLMNRTVDELHSLAAQKELPLQVSANLENPIVTNDAVRIRQILVNLLSNAIKFTDEGSVQVIVKDAENPNGNCTGNGDHIVIAVKDTGCGIEEEALSSIFDPFHQADQRLIRQHGGTGLGLAIVGSLVDMMRGEVNVNSKIHEGTTVSVTIPRTVMKT